jgi:Sigma-70 region 2
VADGERQQEFARFVRSHWSQLMTIAVAVSGSRDEAEDLVQTTLTSACARWQRIRPEEALAYLRRSIANAHVSRWRRHRGAELPVAEPPDVATGVHDAAGRRRPAESPAAAAGPAASAAGRARPAIPVRPARRGDRGGPRHLAGVSADSGVRGAPHLPPRADTRRSAGHPRPSTLRLTRHRLAGNCYVDALNRP